MPRLVLSDPDEGVVRKVALDKLFAHDAGLGLAAGKGLVDRMLDGEEAIALIEDPVLAERIAAEARALGASCRIEE